MDTAAPAIDLLINAEQAVAFLFAKGGAPSPLPGWAKTSLTWATQDGGVVVSQAGKPVGQLPAEAAAVLANQRSALLVEWDADAQKMLDKGNAALAAG